VGVHHSEGFDRRRLLAATGAAGLAGLVGRGTVPAAEAAAVRSRSRAAARVPFYGEHQAGITTPQQDFLSFASFRLVAGDAEALRALLVAWTDAAARLMHGEPLTGPTSGDRPPPDTGEAGGLPASRLTLTFGFGSGVFDRRYGFRTLRPEQLAPLPRFRGDRLDPARSGGDLCVQACADDPQVAFHAVRNLARIGRRAVRLDWVQRGFVQRTEEENGTPRNLMGFRDGTANLDPRDVARMRRNVWAGPESPGWMQGGSYLVARRIRIRIEKWDEEKLAEQERAVGRTKASGAPIGGRLERSPVVISRLDPKAHIRLANPRAGAASEDERILRRGYNFADGLDELGRLDAGLFFIAFQRDPRRQFVPIQTRLARADLLGEYLVHTGSAVFACPPGAIEGGFVGDRLFASASAGASSGT
jgi:deferrochelatase/peroxidase EfeB